MATAPAEIGRLEHHDAGPTSDHFIPLLYLAGLAAAADQPTDVLVAGHAMGSLSMTAYTVGSSDLPVPTDAGSPPTVPDVLADETTL